MNRNNRSLPARLWRGRTWRLGCVGGMALAWALSPPAYAQTQTVTFDIGSQPLASALLSYGRQAGLSVLAPSALVNGKTAPEVKGQFTTAAALEKLLSGSGLQFEFVNAWAVRVVEKTQAARLPLSESPPVDSVGSDRVVIVGTTIRGVRPDSSPVDSYTAEDIARSGATTTEQFVAKLPQNQATNSQFAAGATVASANPNSVTSVDLRGLGVGTTLTLLNGRRMALSNSGQSVDVSLIPVAAIERVEVLTDGASAIYGSDAIGGVINFVLREDFDGAETRLSYGGVTSGGMRQGDASQSFGRSWDSGNGLVSYNYHSASDLQRSDRDFSAPAGRGKLTPDDIRHNVFATVTQHLTDQLTVDADAGFAWRKVKNAYTLPFPSVPRFATFNAYTSTTEQAFGAVGFDYAFSDDLSATLDISFSEVDVDGQRAASFFNRNPVPAPTRTDFSTNDTSFDIVAKLEGVALTLPAGDVRFSLGGGQLEQKYRGISAFTNVQSAGALGRRSPYAFGELFIPIVSAEQHVPFVHRAELSVAARYTDYQDASEPRLSRDFGDSTDPKLGLLWAPTEDLTLRATYGTSFRAPSLTQLDPTSAGHYLVDEEVDGAPGTVFALISQAMPDLGPETAETYSAGFDFRSDSLPGFRLSGTYYSIDYTNRIDMAPSGNLDPFLDAALLPDLMYHPPSAAFIEEQLRASPLFAGLNTTGIDLSDPQAASLALFALPNFWVYDNRFRNLALSEQDGFDLSVSQSLETPLGDARIGGNVTRILSYRQQGSPNSLILSAVESPGQPPHWRGRFFAGLSNGAFDGTLSVNYTDDYQNPWVSGDPTVESWTTVDLNLTYDFGAPSVGENGTRLSLSVQNLFDEDPPFLGSGSNGAILSPIGFDPANANPLGRVVVFGVSQRW